MAEAPVSIVIGRLADGPSPPAAHYYSPCEQCGYSDDGPREWRA